MTVVIALRAGPAMGVACADREITYEEPTERKFQYKARKIVHLGGSYFVGWAGDVGYAERIVYPAKHALADKTTDFRSVVAHLKRNYDALRLEVVRSHVEQALGIGWQDYISGNISADLTKRIAEMLREEAEKPKAFDVDLLICGIDEDGIGEKRDFGIVTYRAPGIIGYSKYSDAIGITDMADIATSEFLESVPARSPHIGIAKCARVVMEAKMKAERRNPRIGRRSQLVWVNGDGAYHETSERETALLNAVINLNQRTGLIKGETVDRIFVDIVEKPITKEERSRATDKAFSGLHTSFPAKDLFKYVFFEDFS